MDNPTEEIKNKIDVVEYLQRYITLQKTGRNFKGLCPFHQESTPSFVVSPERQIWRCFGACQDGGDVIAFAMKWHNLTFFEALKELAEEAGVKLENTNLRDKDWEDKNVIYNINNYTAKYYNFILEKHATAEQARKYLENRGATQKIISTFQLGYSPDSWDSLRSFLHKKKFSDEDIFNAGLLVKGKNGGYYDRFRGRLIFPIIDSRGNILGFSGRLLSKEDKSGAKYVNTPETLVYHKRQTLYGMNVAHESIRKEEKAILVEGEFDMITSFKNGIKNTVAIKGSAVTKDQLQLLKRFTQHLVLALDSDFSGTETTLRAIQDAETMGFRIDIIQFDFGKDPDEALQKDPVTYKKLLEKPKPLYDFVIDTAMQKHDVHDPYGKEKIVEDSLPFLAKIENPIIRNHYMNRLSGLTDISERAIEAMIRKNTYAKKQTQNNIPVKKEKINRIEEMQKHVLSRAIQSTQPPKEFEKIVEILEPSDFTLPPYIEIFKQIQKFMELYKADNVEQFNINNFAENLSDPVRRIFDELVLTEMHAAESDKESEEDERNERKHDRVLYELKRLSIKSRMKSIMAGEETPETKTLVSELTKKLSEVEKQLRVM